MNISLNPNLEKFIHQKIEEGYYNSASEVVRDALRLLIEKETLHKYQIDKLNQDISQDFMNGLQLMEQNSLISFI